MVRCGYISPDLLIEPFNRIEIVLNMSMLHSEAKDCKILQDVNLSIITDYFLSIHLRVLSTW